MANRSEARSPVLQLSPHLVPFLPMGAQLASKYLALCLGEAGGSGPPSQLGLARGLHRLCYLPLCVKGFQCKRHR